MQKFYNSQANEKPLEVDVNSSPDGVYVRRNITETKTDEGTTLFNYEEAFMSQSEYENYKHNQYENVVTDSLKDFTVRRESEIIDDYTLQLVEEGSL